jgi:predicted amidohydrolase
MKIALAQINPIIGNIDQNLTLHGNWIDRAYSAGADLIVFPELSLTGYEPQLAKRLALTTDDPRWGEFQKMSNEKQISIAVGFPLNCAEGLRISMMLIQPDQDQKVYSKQILHADEKPYFVAGDHSLLFQLGPLNLVPAICHESLQTEHAREAHNLRADVYLASVAKSQSGLNKAFHHYPKIAKAYAMMVMMVNCVGHCDDFESVGQSAIWDANGILKAQLTANQEGLLIADTETMEIHPPLDPTR